MAGRSLKWRILLSFFAITAFMALLIGLLGFHVIKKNVIDRAQDEVAENLKAARSVYEGELGSIAHSLELIEPTQENLARLKLKMGLDYVGIVEGGDLESVRSEIAEKCLSTGKVASGTRIVGAMELERMDPALAERATIPVKSTPRARPSERKILDEAIAKECARPVFDANGELEKVVYAGRIINGNYSIVDHIRELAFGDEVYDSKPVGTVTIFQDDIRVSTNVLNKQGERAIGTRVSAEVYEKVVVEGKTWHDRAFVVTDWYKTAYEPIRDLAGNVIGILYVGVLEEPFDDMLKNVFLLFAAIVAGAVVLTIALSFILASAVTEPLDEMHDATIKVSGGDLEQKVNSRTGLTESNKLAAAFNEMTAKLKEREDSLKITNAKLEEANRQYVDLIGFVAHELKGMLASTVLNAYSVRDGLLGLINFKQRKAMDSITRNLDYLTSTVRKFLNLGRIERGELSINPVEVNLKREVFDVSAESLTAMFAKKHMKVENEIDPELTINADQDLLQIVANNLLTNAIKYGFENGSIVMRSRDESDKVRVEVYNDSEPITDEQKAKLFQKFSRIRTEENKRVKGTGLGLYITKQIVESHGGRIWVESSASGNSFIFELKKGL